MKLRALFVATLAVSTLLVFPGCSTLNSLRGAKTAILTTPEGATASVDGGPARVTPLTTRLSASRPHTIVASKDGSARTAVAVLPATVKGEAARQLIWAAGYALSDPSPVKPHEISLTLASGQPDADAFTALQTTVLQADALQKAGKLTDKEHKYLVRQIVNFYAP